jgi:hypothetical protein
MKQKHEQERRKEYRDCDVGSSATKPSRRALGLPGPTDTQTQHGQTRGPRGLRLPKL